MNLIILTGRMTRDPELKYGKNGKAYCKFSIAVDRQFKKGEADFINCSAFGKTAEIIAEYMRKGSKICVQGRLNMNQYEKEGSKVTAFDVIVDQFEFLDSKKTDSQESETVTLPRKLTAEEQKKQDDSDDFPF